MLQLHPILFGGNLFIAARAQGVKTVIFSGCSAVKSSCTDSKARITVCSRPVKE